jgi:hypothetical protein
MSDNNELGILARRKIEAKLLSQFMKSWCAR